MAYEFSLLRIRFLMSYACDHHYLMTDWDFGSTSNIRATEFGTKIYFCLTIPEEYITLKSINQHQLSMMGGSNVVLTIYADIHNVEVQHLFIIIIIFTYNCY
jgi:hypothetical protein